MDGAKLKLAEKSTNFMTLLSKKLNQTGWPKRDTNGTPTFCPARCPVCKRDTQSGKRGTKAASKRDTNGAQAGRKRDTTNGGPVPPQKKTGLGYLAPPARPAVIGGGAGFRGLLPGHCTGQEGLLAAMMGQRGAPPGHLGTAGQPARVAAAAPLPAGQNVPIGPWWAAVAGPGAPSGVSRDRSRSPAGGGSWHGRR